MNEILYMDLLHITHGVIVQQVNCRGAMGRGLAYAIRQKWPQVYLAYRRAYQAGQWRLGNIQIVQVPTTEDHRLYVCNLAGQDAWGTDKQQTDTLALRVAFRKLHHWAFEHYLPVYAPWLFGCGLAGGDWEEVRPMIEECCPGLVWVRRDQGEWERRESFRGDFKLVR